MVPVDSAESGDICDDEIFTEARSLIYLFRLKQIVATTANNRQAHQRLRVSLVADVSLT